MLFLIHLRVVMQKGVRLLDAGIWPMKNGSLLACIRWLF